MTRAAALAIALAGINLAVAPLGAAEKADASKFSQRGATEKTPSYSQYFSWINNTNEGSTDHNTMVNLDFFEWLHTEYGMTLDIYVISAGAIDGPRRYGTMTEDRFKANFPKGWGHIYEKAKAMDTRLGTWLGPDGFGDTREEEIARRDMIVSLCRDYNFALLKMDAVCSQLREPKQEALKKTLIECRKHCPDMILLNHRLKLGAAEPYATTFLWGGAETYIDVHMANWASPAPHNRATALMRPLPPDLMRLTEDHGVCISSCLDFWDDDLVLQAFNRCLILAPQTYGNPWFLRDEEYPRFARINNLHRRFRDIMVDGMVLPEEQYGPYAVSRGDESTRLVTLRNLSWEPKKYTVKLDKSVGLAGSGRVELRQLHPTERIIGRYPAGGEVTVEVLPFRACLLLATSTPSGELGVTGCDYHVVRDLPGKPAVIKLLGLPGTTASVKLAPINRSTYTGVTLNGKAAPALLEGQAMDVTFPGKPLKKKWHRKLGDLKPVAIPADAEALYEASCFAADSNALEYRAIERSGPTKIKQIQAARDVFFAQQLLRERGCWDRFMFDGDDKTYFGGSSRVRPVRGGALRLDFGEQLRADTLTITGTYDDSGLWSEIAPKYLTDAKGRPGGLTGEYFTGSTFEGKPVVTRTDRQISFRWRNDPAQGVPVRDFCVRWTGKITPVTSGTYRFVCKAPSAQLWVGGKQIIGGGAGGVVDLKANQAYDIKMAIGVIRQMEKYDILRVEQPVHYRDLDGMALVRRSVEVPIGACESAMTAHDVAQVIKKEAADFLNLKVTRSGGFYPSKAMAQMAVASGMFVVSSTQLGMGIEVAADAHFGVSNRGIGPPPHIFHSGPSGILKLFNCVDSTGITRDIVDGTPSIADGFLSVPQGPGLGVALNKEHLHFYLTKGKAAILVGVQP